jgi:cell division protein FtsI/penicillin-binding protein 2
MKYEVVGLSKQQSKRMIHFLILFNLLLFFLIGRLAQIQLIDTESFSEHSVNLIVESIEQRTHSFRIDDGRGKVLDRNGDILSSHYKPALILFPFVKNHTDALENVARILDVPLTALTKPLEEAQKPFVYKKSGNEGLTEDQIEAINELEIAGIYAQNVKSESLDRFANHFIGVVRENPELIQANYPEKLEKGLVTIKTELGVMGVEEAFDPFLLSEGETKLVYHVDRQGTPLFGLDVKYAAPANPFYPVELHTTLDKPLQEIVESAVDLEGITNGGALLLDVNTSDVLAMVSRPLFSLAHPFDEGTENKLLTSWTPGSVFKIVTAAAAIEKNMIEPNQLFNCDMNVYNEEEDKNRKLGNLSFEDSFTQSCNVTFGSLAKELMAIDDGILEEYAQKLGITGPVGWKGDVYHFQQLEHFPDETAGKIWDEEAHKKIKDAVPQTAIGQFNVRITPLAVANMMATIARGGEKKQVRAATEITYKNGTSLASFPNQKLEEETLSRYATIKLQSMLREVVKDPKGTGYYGLHDLPYSVAGKSGTAQKGTGTDDGNEDSSNDTTTNYWFAGYFPAEKPKYALVVLDLEYGGGENKVKQTFAEIVENIHEHDLQQN